MERAGGRVRGNAAVRAAEATATTAAMMAAMAAAVMAASVALWTVSASARVVAVARVEGYDGGSRRQWW